MKIIVLIFSICYLNLSFSQFTTTIQSTSIEIDSFAIDYSKIPCYELTDGTLITKAQLDSIFQAAWDNSFGKMSKEEEDLLFGDVNFFVETKFENKEIEKRRKRKKQSQKN